MRKQKVSYSMTKIFIKDGQSSSVRVGHQCTGTLYFKNDKDKLITVGKKFIPSTDSGYLVNNPFTFLVCSKVNSFCQVKKLRGDFQLAMDMFTILSTEWDIPMPAINDNDWVVETNTSYYLIQRV